MIVSVELTTIDCGACGGSYAINEKYRKRCQEHALGWHCPYCQCSWGYFGDSEAEKARKQLAAERARHDQTRAELQRTEARRRAEKAAKTRIKNRVTKGVCPCCNRHFVNLQRHMQNKHPEYAGAV